MPRLMQIKQRMWKCMVSMVYGQSCYSSQYTPPNITYRKERVPNNGTGNRYDLYFLSRLMTQFSRVVIQMLREVLGMSIPSHFPALLLISSYPDIFH